MAILPIVVGALSYAVISLLTLQQGTATSVADSADAQTVSAYYEQDVQSSANITTSASSAQCGPGTQLLGLEWNFNSQTSQFQTVVSYVETGSGQNLSLVRQYCASGASTTPTSRSYVSHDIPAGQLVPTVTPSAKNTAAQAGWTSSVGVTGVSFSIDEPGSNFTYALFSVPRASVSASQLSGVGPPSASCGFSTPGTGTYASTLCFVDFTNYNYLSTSGKCQTMTAAIVNTPYTLSFCILTTATPSSATGRACLATSGPLLPATAVPCPIPTYFAAPTSEAFLGNNGFYTGIPGNPALYANAEGSTVTIDISNIQLLDSSGHAATGWELVTGDAESTDAGESLTWTSNQNFSLLWNTPTSAYGNACAAPAPGQGLSGVGTANVTCASTVSSDKTGTVMLEASAPSTLHVQMVGAGLEGMFMGVLLP
jgi:hypothetical protein